MKKNPKLLKGSFTNYVDKTRYVIGPGKSMVCRFSLTNVNQSWVGGQDWAKFGQRCLWTPPNLEYQKSFFWDPLSFNSINKLAVDIAAPKIEMCRARATIEFWLSYEWEHWGGLGLIGNFSPLLPFRFLSYLKCFLYVQVKSTQYKKLVTNALRFTH